MKLNPIKVLEFEEYQCDSVYLIRHYDIEIKRLYEKYKIIEYYNHSHHARIGQDPSFRLLRIREYLQLEPK